MVLSGQCITATKKLSMEAASCNFWDWNILYLTLMYLEIHLSSLWVDWDTFSINCIILSINCIMYYGLLLVNSLVLQLALKTSK